MGKLDGKTAIVTGGASGIGAATVRTLADEGANVVVADISPTDEIVGEIGAKALGASLDVRDPDQWARVVEAAVEKFGALDILVNNAGILSFSTLEDLTPEEIRRVIDVNLMGTIYGVRAAIPALVKQGGAIVNVSSADGLTSHNAATHYCASKWGVRGFTKAAAMELAHRGVRVNSVHPGGVHTPLANPTGIPKDIFDANNPMIKKEPLGRTAHPEEIADAILFLVGPDSSFCVGSELAVDGGMTCGSYISMLPGAPNRK